MEEMCLICWAEKEHIMGKYPGENVCEHCFYRNYGCDGTEATTFTMKPFTLTERFVIAEQSPEELPKTRAWCNKCKENCGKVIHATIWNARDAYAIKCPRCGNEWLLYKSRYQQQYTGYINGKGEYVSPDRLMSGAKKQAPDVRAEVETAARRGGVQIQREQPQAKYTFSSGGKEPTAMELAMRKAMEKNQQQQ